MWGGSYAAFGESKLISLTQRTDGNLYTKKYPAVHSHPASGHLLPEGEGIKQGTALAKRRGVSRERSTAVHSTALQDAGAFPVVPCSLKLETENLKLSFHPHPASGHLLPEGEGISLGFILFVSFVLFVVKGSRFPD